MKITVTIKAKDGKNSFSCKNICEKTANITKKAKNVFDRTTDLGVKAVEKCEAFSELPDKTEAICEKIEELSKKAHELKADISYDIDAIMERDPAARSRVEAALLYSGFHARMAHRLSHSLNNHGAHFAARMVSQGAKFLTGIEIHPGATIGRGLFIDHGAGVVIGETTVIGDDCTLYQGCTLGGTGKQTGKRHPTLGNNVMVGAGAKILGNFTVGDNSKIAAGAVVLSSVPEDSTAVGIPAKVVRRGGQKLHGEQDLDQTHIPDPVSLRMCAMQFELDKLKKEVDVLEEEVEEEIHPHKDVTNE